MGHQVEDGCGVAEGAKGQHHQAQMADGRVSQYSLQVGGHQGYRRGSKRRYQTDDRDHDQRVGVVGFKERECSGHQEDAGDHHGRGMYQSADRGWAFHGVGQPNVEGHLRGLAHGAQEQQQGGGRCHSLAHGAGADRLEGVQHGERAYLPPDEQDAYQQANIADPGDDKGLLGCFPGLRPLVPEPDQQVRADPHQLPGDVEQQEVVGQHQGEHGGGEEGMDREVPAKARVALHVGQGIDLDHQGHESHQAQHGDGQRVDQDAPEKGDAARGPDYPGVEPDPFVVTGEQAGILAGEAAAGGVAGAQPGIEHEPENHEPAADGQDRQPRALPRQVSAEDHDDRRGGKAEHRYEPGPLHQDVTQTGALFSSRPTISSS